MNILKKIHEVYTVQKYPKLYIYIVSNDKFFITLFLKKFNLEYEFIIKEFSEYQTFLSEIQLIDSSKRRIPIIITDNTIFQNDELKTYFFEQIDSLFSRKPETLVIFLESLYYDFNQNTHPYTCIYKNDNAYKRIEQIIFTHSNELFLKKHEKDNKKIFKYSIITIITTILFLVFYIIFAL